MIRRFTHGRIVTPDGVLAGADLVTQADRIVAVGPVGTFPADAVVDLDGGWLMPGFIDTQVNGGGGVLFNDAPTVEGIRAIGAAHAPFGTTGYMTTLISDDPHMVAQALDATDAAIEQGVPGVLGAHIEGPFLNVARKGIHDASKFRRLDADMMAMLTRPRRGRVMLTLAPELADPVDLRTLADAGVILSAGHSDASYEEIATALAAGLRGFTHLYNAMSPLMHRAPGVVGAALDDQTAWCGLIVDGAHLHPAVIRIALRARPLDRFMLVTDAMPSVGMTDKAFSLGGRPIRVENGVCVNDDGTLAGCDLDMASAVRNLVRTTGTDPAVAAAMAATHPAAFLRLSADRGALAPGLRADWVQLDADFTALATTIGGEVVA